MWYAETKVMALATKEPVNYCKPVAKASAPVAQLDRVLPSEGRGHRFESCRVRHFSWVKSYT